MLGFARLWAVTALIAGAVGENQCNDKECIAPCVAGDENSLLQKADGQHLGGQVVEGPGYGLLQFSLSKCAESFACGVIAKKAEGQFEGWKGWLAKAGSSVACGQVEQYAPKYFKKYDFKNVVLDAHKAQPCIQKTELDFINNCAQKYLTQEKQKMVAAGEGGMINNYEVLAKGKRQCNKKMAPKTLPNLTIASELYKKCGYPGLAQKLAAMNKHASSDSQTEAMICQVAGMAAVLLHNFLTTQNIVQEEVKDDDEDATKEDNGDGPDEPKDEPEPNEPDMNPADAPGPKVNSDVDTDETDIIDE